MQAIQLDAICCCCCLLIVVVSVRCLLLSCFCGATDNNIVRKRETERKSGIFGDEATLLPFEKSSVECWEVLLAKPNAELINLCAFCFATSFVEHSGAAAAPI